MTALTDGERETLLTPCGCGHSINDHGTLCWVCAEGDDLGARVPCVRGFEALLVERLGGIVAGRVKARLAGVVAVHARYFDLDGEPGWDDTNPEPEDVWRYDREFRAALTEMEA